MHIKRLLFFLLCMISFQSLYGIFGIRLVIPWDPWKKEEIDVNSRKYLYEILKHSPNFILTKEVKENREYYIKLIEQHIKVLQEKKNKFNFGQFKKFTIATLWTAAALSTLRSFINKKDEIKNLKDQNSSISSFISKTVSADDLAEKRGELFGITIYLVPFCYFATTRLYKAILYKAEVQQRLERDLHILNLLQQK